MTSEAIQRREATERARERHSANFYDSFWPRNVPVLQKALQHTLNFVPDRMFRSALDAGCGSGVSAIALLERSARVTAIDNSRESLRTSKKLADGLGARIEFEQGSLMDLPFCDKSFDLVYCYGVLSFTPDPHRCLRELARVLAHDGVLVLAVYQTTWMSPFHDVFQVMLHRCPKAIQEVVIKIVSWAIAALAWISGRKSKDYGLPVEAKVRDFYLTPVKKYFDSHELMKLLAASGICPEIRDAGTGRFKSASNIVVVGTKRTK